MGKHKKKKNRRLAEKVTLKKKETSIETNPFEIHVNRVKHKVLGRKSKNDKGLPGIAREKALQKRKETLLQEYKNRFKANRFRDKRIGENDAQMTLDDKMTARFALEHKRRKKDLFNLNDDEELTHYGQSLAEIEKFDDPKSDEDEDDDELANEFMKESHFGGFLKLKENPSTDNEKPKSRKEWIEELIVTSKQRKHDRQNEREETHEMTEKLDSDWKEIQSLVMAQKASVKDIKNPEKPDSYDVIVRSLKFEGRAKASDRLKTPEELALEVKTNLEKMEAERIRRMQGLEDDAVKEKFTNQHRSADDLDDNFYIEDKSDKKKVRFLEYKDGKLLSDDEDDMASCSKKSRNNSKVSDGGVVSDEDNGESGDEDTGDDGDAADDDDIEGDGAQEGTSSEDSEEDDFSDLATDEESEEEVDEKLKKNSSQIKASENGKENEPDKVLKLPLKETKEELPYVFSAPSSYEEFKNLINKYSKEDSITIIERIIKCHHISLAEENRKKLECLFEILLQYIQDLASARHPDLKTVGKLAPYLFQLAEVSPLNAGQCMRDVLKDKYNKFCKSSHSYLSGERSPFPNLDTLILFKVIAVLFSTSDFHHPVATPAMLFMGQILSKCRVKNITDVAKGLFVCTLFYEYVSFSKRFVPEALNFLCGILSLCIGNDLRNPSMVVHPFRIVDNPFLKIEAADAKDIEPSPLNMEWMIKETEVNDAIRVSVLKATCELIKLFAQLYDELTSFREIFQPLQEWWKKLTLEKYPNKIKDNFDYLEGMMAKPRKYAPLQSERKRPKALKLLNPKIELNFDPDKRRRGGQKNSEKQRLLHRYKRELKGATREIRRDNHFLAKQQLDEQLERDSERKRKVKELYSSLANQEGDYKALVKKKEKAK